MDIEFQASAVAEAAECLRDASGDVYVARRALRRRGFAALGARVAEVALAELREGGRVACDQGSPEIVGLVAQNAIWTTYQFASKHPEDAANLFNALRCVDVSMGRTPEERLQAEAFLDLARGLFIDLRAIDLEILEAASKGLSRT